MPSEGGLATGLGSIYKDGDNIWIGWPGLAVSKADHQKEITKKLKTESMKPVFLTNTEIEEFYEGFSNETLWPNFHYFNQYIVFDDDMWRAYQKVNRKFARAIAEVLEPEDTIWVHDYQLLLLPEMLREFAPKASIGFFLHIPFPSYESFRLLPWRRELLEGMLGADFLGFHTYDDMRHFLSSVNRLAGLGNSNGMINVDNRKVMVDALPMGIDYDKYAESAAAKETLEREARYRESIGAQKLILSIDRLDYSKGLPDRFQAFGKLLAQHPELEKQVTFLQVAPPTREDVNAYSDIRDELEGLTGSINGRFSDFNWTPLRYIHRPVPRETLAALFRASHVGLVTPLRDGMNLVAKEFVAAQDDEDPGVLVLSQFAGAAEDMTEALIVNPYDTDTMAEAIHQALVMPLEERKARHKALLDHILHQDTQRWLATFLSDLETAGGHTNPPPDSLIAADAA